MIISAQPIITPDSEICTELDLYFRSDDIVQYESGKLLTITNNSASKISFDTYFNSFSAGKWIEYTNIKNAFLSINVFGKGVIRIIKSNIDLKSVGVNNSIVHEVFFDAEEEKELKIDLRLGDLTFRDTISFEVYFVRERSYINEVAYCVDVAPSNINQVKLALASCTYKKEKYINKTLSLIDRYVINAHPDYNIRTYIVDNGDSLDYDLCDKYKHVTLIKSKNLGASGGFSRALFCAIQNDDTHVVSLDDDILFNPHSVNLLYNFLRCLKIEFIDYVVGGAMLIYDKQYLQHDSGSYLDKNRLYGINRNLDLRNYYNCLLNSVQEYHDKTFNGFWFCCYPVHLLKLKGLTYPFFMKGDDVELGIRIFNKRMLSLNGICTWHESFDKKFTPVYSNIYELRNLLIIYSTQFENYSAVDACCLFVKRALKELFFYRYKGVDLTCKGVELFLQGTNGIRNIDDEKIVRDNQIYRLRNSVESRCNLSYKNILLKKKSKKESLIRKIFRLITFNGNIIPDFFLKNSVVVPTVTASMKDVFGYKNIIHYDFNEYKLYVTKNSKIDFFKSLFNIFQVSLKIFFKYKKVQADYVSNFTQLTSIEFWEEKFKQSDRK